MKGKILLLRDDCFPYNYNIQDDLDYGYCISINTDLSESFEDLINGSHDLDESIAFEISFNENESFENASENIIFLRNCREKQGELLLNAEYVEFNFSIDEIVSYVQKNPILKTKKILLNDSLGLNTEMLKRISDAFDGFTDNLYFKLSDNSELVCFNDCNETYKILERMAREIEKFDFSPLEKIMYVYDVVRNKVYVEVDENVDKYISRDLSSVLLGNKRVCLGYARMFDALLAELGIDTRVVYLYNKEENSGHARNEIYVKDEKYGIDGVYYFDATWDSKKEESDNRYLLSYRCFAKTKSEMDMLDEGKIIDNRFPYFSSDIACTFLDICEQKGFDKIPKDMIRSINHMSTLVNGKYLINGLVYYENSPFYGRLDIEKTTSKLANIVEYFDNPIPANVLLKVLYNVRKNQYYSDPSKYPFSLNDFYKIVLLSNWYFNGITPDEKLLVAILAAGAMTNTWEHMINYDEETELSKSIEQVRLTRTLRKVYESKLRK